MSAFGGKADVARECRTSLFDRSGHVHPGVQSKAATKNTLLELDKVVRLLPTVDARTRRLHHSVCVCTARRCCPWTQLLLARHQRVDGLHDSPLRIEYSSHMPRVAAKPSRLAAPTTTLPLRIVWRDAIGIVVLHILALLAFLPWLFSWTGVIVMVIGLYLFGMIGVGLGFHRPTPIIPNR